MILFCRNIIQLMKEGGGEGGRKTNRKTFFETFAINNRFQFHGGKKRKIKNHTHRQRYNFIKQHDGRHTKIKDKILEKKKKRLFYHSRTGTRIFRRSWIIFPNLTSL